MIKDRRCQRVGDVFLEIGFAFTKIGFVNET
jgi:hypothetical protein